MDAFPDGETRVRIEENVRGTDVYVVQSTCAPVNQNLMQLLIMIDAMRRAPAERVTAVIPYFGYARQEKKSSGHEPITGKLVANLLQAAGTARVVTLDLHAPAVERFFDVPVDHLRAAPLLAEALRKMDPHYPVVVSPDTGGVARAYEFSGRLGNDSLAIVFKDRTAPDSVLPLRIVGDVDGRQAILVDDLISTGGRWSRRATPFWRRGRAQLTPALPMRCWPSRLSVPFCNRHRERVHYRHGAAARAPGQRRIACGGHQPALCGSRATDSRQ